MSACYSVVAGPPTQVGQSKAGVFSTLMGTPDSHSFLRQHQNYQQEQQQQQLQQEYPGHWCHLHLTQQSDLSRKSFGLMDLDFCQNGKRNVNSHQMKQIPIYFCFKICYTLRVDHDTYLQLIHGLYRKAVVHILGYLYLILCRC